MSIGPDSESGESRPSSPLVGFEWPLSVGGGVEEWSSCAKLSSEQSELVGESRPVTPPRGLPATYIQQYKVQYNYCS